jgi:hypothetical protein
MGFRAMSEPQTVATLMAARQPSFVDTVHGLEHGEPDADDVLYRSASRRAARAAAQSATALHAAAPPAAPLAPRPVACTLEMPQTLASIGGDVPPADARLATGGRVRGLGRVGGAVRLEHARDDGDDGGDAGGAADARMQAGQQSFGAGPQFNAGAGPSGAAGEAPIESQAF